MSKDQLIQFSRDLAALIAKQPKDAETAEQVMFTLFEKAFTVMFAKCLGRFPGQEMVTAMGDVTFRALAPFLEAQAVPS